MITVTFTSKGDIVVIPPIFDGIFGLDGFPGLLVPGSPKRRYKTGLRPISGPADAYGEKPCFHDNVQGHIMSLGLNSSVITPRVKSYAYYDSASTRSVTNVVRCMASRSNTNRWFSHLFDVTTEEKLRISEPWKYNILTTYPTVVYDKSNRWSELIAITPTKFTSIAHLVRVSLSTGLVTQEVYQYTFHEFNDTYTQCRKLDGPLYWNDPKAYYPLLWKAPTGAWNAINSYDRLVLSEDSPDLESTFSRVLLYESAELIRSKLVITNPLGFGDLANQAAGNTRYLDINTSKYFADLLHIGELLKPFSGLSIASNLTLKQLMKLISSSVLVGDYGVKLTVADTMEIFEAAERIRQQRKALLVCYEWQIARSRGAENASISLGGRNYVAESTKTLKFRYKPHDDGLLKFLSDLDAWDLLPTLKTAWDFVPFSYLVNALIPQVGAYMKRVDGNTHKALLRVGDCVYSSNRTVRGIDPKFLFGQAGQFLWGSVDITLYERHVVATLPISDISRIPGTEVNYDGWARSVRDGLFVLIQSS